MSNILDFLGGSDSGYLYPQFPFPDMIEWDTRHNHLPTLENDGSGIDINSTRLRRFDKTETLIWTVDKTDIHASCYYLVPDVCYNTTDNSFWLLGNSDSTFYTTKVDALTGTVTYKGFCTMASPFTSNLNTSNTFLYYDNATGHLKLCTYQASNSLILEIDPSNGSLISETIREYDGTGMGGFSYMTADEKIFTSAFINSNGELPNISMTRAANIINIEITAILDSAVTLADTYIVVKPWFNDYIYFSFSTTTNSPEKRAHLILRSEYDQWLHDIADHYSLPTI